MLVAESGLVISALHHHNRSEADGDSGFGNGPAGDREFMHGLPAVFTSTEDVARSVLVFRHGIGPKVPVVDAHHSHQVRWSESGFANPSSIGIRSRRGGRRSTIDRAG